MSRSSIVAAAAGLFAILASPANAQATRTWVSGVGDDVNPCSRTAPCKTFAGAISKTAASGEINCLDPAGFGTVTITKSINIDCSNTLGGILSSLTTGIIVNGANVVVSLRGITIDGAGNGTIGIRIINGARILIDDVKITGGTQQGIVDQRTVASTPSNQLVVKNSVVRAMGGSGIALSATAATAVVIDNVTSTGNAFGVAVGAATSAMVSRSVLSGNSTAGLEADPGAQVVADANTISSNGIGVQNFGIIRLANSNIALNTTGISGATTSFGNNRIAGNGSAGTAPTAAGGASTDLGQQ